LWHHGNLGDSDSLSGHFFALSGGFYPFWRPGARIS
jgi:hypothetical protein